MNPTAHHWWVAGFLWLWTSDGFPSGETRAAIYFDCPPGDPKRGYAPPQSAHSRGDAVRTGRQKYSENDGKTLANHTLYG